MTRVAVIGAGRFGAEHLAAYRTLPSAELVGLLDADPTRAGLGGRRSSRRPPTPISTPCSPRGPRAVVARRPCFGSRRPPPAPGRRRRRRPHREALADDAPTAAAIARDYRDLPVLCGHVVRFAEPYVRVRDLGGDPIEDHRRENPRRRPCRRVSLRGRRRPHDGPRPRSARLVRGSTFLDGHRIRGPGRRRPMGRGHCRAPDGRAPPSRSRPPGAAPPHPIASPSRATADRPSCTSTTAATSTVPPSRPNSTTSWPAPATACHPTSSDWTGAAAAVQHGAAVREALQPRR